MKSFTAAALAAIASIASAAPAVPTVSDMTLKSFTLETQLISGDASFGGLYLTMYKTDQLDFVPTFTSNADLALTGYINGTVAVFGYVKGGPNKMALSLSEPVDSQAGWAGLTLDVVGQNIAGPPQPAAATGFSVGVHGYFQHTKGGASDFTGWRVCNWVHAVPELYYKTAQMASETVPCNCADVFIQAKYT